MTCSPQLLRPPGRPVSPHTTPRSAPGERAWRCGTHLTTVLPLLQAAGDQVFYPHGDSLMKVEKVPDSTYDMIGGLDQQIKEIKEV